MFGLFPQRAAMANAPGIEERVGIEWYATRGPPCAGKAKSRAEDFMVEEQVEGLVVSPVDVPGSLPLYRVEKRSIDTMHMAAELSEELKSRVSFAGLKDKMAVAVQYVTPTSVRSERPERVAREKFTALRIGYVSTPVARSALIGNRFDILLRGCCPEVGDRIEEALDLARRRRIPNFYGLQRFGGGGGGTHVVGRSLVRGDFEGAVSTMLLSEHSGASGRAAKESFEAGRYEEGAKALPPGRDSERRVARELGRHPGEWVRALRSLPVRLRRLYVHAYQSYIFNRTLSAALREEEDISVYKKGDNWCSTSNGGLVVHEPRGVRDEPSGEVVPLVQVPGYAFRDYGSRFDRILVRVLSEEGVRPANFFLREMQEVSAEGGFRRPHLALRDESWERESEDARVRFTLGKGQYATVLLREVSKPQDPVAAGLG